MNDLIEHIDVKAQSGLCAMSFSGCREFLKDIRAAIAKARKQPSPTVRGKLIPYVAYEGGKPELWMGYMDKDGLYNPVYGPDPVPKSWKLP